MGKVCKLCGNEIIGDRIKARGATICRECYGSLPKGVQGSITDLTPKQLGQFKKLMKPFPKSGWLWRSYGNFGLRPDSIVLNGMEYKLRDLRSVKLNFHPRELGREPSTAKGDLTLVIETKSPHFLIEETFVSGYTTAHYTICGMDIFYNYPEEAEAIMTSLRKAINNGDYVIEEAKQEEDRIKREEQLRREQEKKQKSRAGKKGSPHPETPFDAALKQFGMRPPFTQEDLRKRRREIVARERLHPDDHPDQADSDTKFKELQEAYDILRKFASD